VPRVARGGRDLRVETGRVERHRRVLAVVVGVQRVVRRAGMLRVALQDGGGDPAGLERDRLVPAAVGDCREQRQRVERRGLVVARVLARELGHASRVGPIARGFVPIAEQRLDRSEVGLLARRRRLRLPRRGGGRQTIQRRTRLVDALVVPERLIVAERLAPVRQRKAWIDALRLAERRNRIVVLEAVEEQHAADERRLRGGRAGVGKGDASEERRRLRCRDRQRERGEHAAKSAGHRRRSYLLWPASLPATLKGRPT
jgi:hypothetical protein